MSQCMPPLYDITANRAAIVPEPIRNKQHIKSPVHSLRQLITSQQSLLVEFMYMSSFIFEMASLFKDLTESILYFWLCHLPNTVSAVLCALLLS